MKFLNTTKKQSIAAVVVAVLMVGAAGTLLVVNSGGTPAVIPVPTVAAPLPTATATPSIKTHPMSNSAVKTLAKKVLDLLVVGKFDQASGLIAKATKATGCSFPAYASIDRSNYQANVQQFGALAVGVKAFIELEGKVTAKKLIKQVEDAYGQDFNGLNLYLFVAEVCA